MKIEADEKRAPVPGDFGDVGSDRRLHVSPKVFGVVRSIGALTAEALYDAANDNPKVLANMLDWSPEQVKVAVLDLQSEIAKVRPSYFEQPLEDPQSFRFGAMPPRRK
jgi:hypothetical protein